MRVILCLGLVLVGPLALRAQAPDPKRWDKAMAAFDEQDKATPPPRAPIVFTGSSSITRWKDVGKTFAEFPVINRGFGGSQTPDVNYHLDRVVLRYEPRLVVLYSGSNDLAAGRTPEQVLEEFRKFVTRIHEKFPKTGIVYLSIHTPPGRLKLKDVNERTNDLIRTECGKDARLAFVDIRAKMLGSDGQPIAALYADPLHPTMAAYELWAEVLRPALKQRYER